MGADSPRRLNRLAAEMSPYLLQHAENPVDWYPWGEEAFTAAAKDDRPIFLSIGYATCHWCHVMEQLCFEDSEVADLMNTTFVNIKVDREERPDIDHVYMSVCQILTGSGGWPLTILMTPDRRPFFAATFIPKHSRFGRPGMMELIPRVAELWRSDRSRLVESAGKIRTHLHALASDQNSGALEPSVLERAQDELADRFDTVYGGFGQQPKFPSPHNLVFLTHRSRGSAGSDILDMVTRTLDAMRGGGIYDQLGYGFHRYSTDASWLVPHFEKMLYDQAMHVFALAEAYRATGLPRFRQTVTEIALYLETRLRAPEGFFFSAEDADSEGEEGLHYLWTAEQIRNILSPEEERVASMVWGVKDEGNYGDEVTGEVTGRNILHRAVPVSSAAAAFSLSPEEVESQLESARVKLLETRERRVRPLLDDKVLCDWNGLTIAALARASRLLEEPRLLELAVSAEHAVQDNLRDQLGILHHRWRQGDLAVPALLDDLAFLAWGELELYDATLEFVYLERALYLTEQILERFRNPESGALYMTAHDGEELLVRPRDTYDGAFPSGNSVATWVLLRVGRLTGRDDCTRAFETAVDSVAADALRAPDGHTFLLWSVDQSLTPALSVVVVGRKQDPLTRQLVEVAHRARRSGDTIALVDPEQRAELERLLPHQAHYPMVEGRPTAYACRDFACGPPITDPSELARHLEDSAVST